MQHGKGVKGDSQTKTQTEARKLTKDEKRECTPKPDSKVKHGHWSKWVVDCVAGHAVKTRTVSTTDYVWKHGKWVLDHKNTETNTERDTRGLKDHEKRECTPKPDPIVKYSHWSKWTADREAGHA